MPTELAKRGSGSSRGEEELLAKIGDSSVSIPPRLVVVAPHPDDEVLGLGGFLSRCAGVGSVIEIVAVSEGEAAYPLADLDERKQLGETRAAERNVALRSLGLLASTVRRLGFPDGKVAEAEEQLRDRLVESLRAEATSEAGLESTVLIAPWRHDLHPDHEAAGRAAFAAANACGCLFWEVPIWSWYHLPDLDVPFPTSRAAVITLSDRERTAKLVALDCFQSQIHPPEPQTVLPIDFLSAFDHDFEIVFR